MQIIVDPREFQALAWSWRGAGLATALVPTMGALHAGHMALIDAARARAARVMVSIFVNPAQFGPAEDLAAYPRPFERDCALAEERGADVIFAPAPQGMYLPGHDTWVEVPGLSAGLCGASRPTHFKGVATVVAKFLILAAPTVAVFGEKDWQQLAVIRRMARDLNLPTEIVGHPTVREADGLAMSSRNAYLTPEERRQAPALHAAMANMRRAVAAGQSDAGALLAEFRIELSQTMPAGRVDYAVIVHPDELTPLERIGGPALLAAAVFLGKARLIDNLRLS